MLGDKNTVTNFDARGKRSKNIRNCSQSSTCRISPRPNEILQLNRPKRICSDKKKTVPLPPHTQVECAEFSGPESQGYGGKGTAWSSAGRLFRARESAAELAIGLEEKVCHNENKTNQ